MASKRAMTRAATLLAALAVVLVANAPAASPQSRGSHVSVIVVPEAVAVQMFESHPMFLGLSVYPESRDPMRFLREIGRGGPRSTGAEQPSLIGDVLCEVGAGGSVSFEPASRSVAVAIMESLRGSHPCGGPGFGFGHTGPNQLTVHVVEALSEADYILGSSTGVSIILGLGGRTPVRVGLCDANCPSQAKRPASAVLAGGITRRPGIVTPYDLGVTILDRLGISPISEGFIGKPLTSEPDPDALQRIDALARRLERDDSFAPGLAASAVGTGGLLVIFGWVLRRMRRNALALRLAQAAVFVLPGWVLAEFIPSSAWGVRAIPIFAGALLGASMKLRDPIRTMARVGFGAALVFALIVAIAPLNPGGEPGLSIWGNPLVSWRFFGVQNVQAAIIASGMVVWGVLAGLSAPVLAVVAVAAAIVTGAPAIGANFVGVLTFIFGAAVAVTALVRRRMSLGQLLASGALAVGAFVLALLADAGSPVSHGGRAARRISSDGWSAAWDLIEGRLRLNVELIGDFSGGWFFVALLLVTLAALIAWGLRTEQGPLRARVAVLAGALMALASMVLEDSGFYSGAVLWFVAADAWLLVTLVRRPEVTPPIVSAPPDAAG